MAAAPIIGIDFGTANSVVAVYQEQEQWPEVILNDIGNRSTPSVVAVQDAGCPGPRVLVGEAAAGQAILQPAATLRGVKWLLGRPLRAVLGDDPPALGPALRIVPDPDPERQHAPRVAMHGQLLAAEVAAMVLRKLRTAAEQHLEQEVTRAVVAVPCHFNSAQRQAVRSAGYIAGLDVVVVNETSAAGLVYSGERGPDRTAVLVDLGAGSSSMAVVRTGPLGAVRVLACSGTRLPAGDHLDAVMMERFQQIIYTQYHHQDLANCLRAQAVLRREWEKAKANLSEVSSVTIKVFLPGLDIEFQQKVRRSDLEQLCEPHSGRLRAALVRLLEDAKVSRGDVDDVVLVGRSSRVALFRSTVADVFNGKPLCKVLNQEESVAVGAALLGAALSGTGPGPGPGPGPGELLQDVTPLRLNLKLRRSRLCHALRVVTPHSRIPVTKAIDPYLLRCVQVYQSPEDSEDGAESLIAEYQVLDQTLVTMSSSMNDELRIAMDSTGIVSVDADKSRKLLPTISFVLSDRCLEMFRISADEQQDDEKKYVKRLEARNDLERQCRQLVSKLTDGSEAMKIVTGTLERLERDHHAGGNYASISRELERLEEYVLAESQRGTGTRETLTGTGTSGPASASSGVQAGMTWSVQPLSDDSVCGSEGGGENLLNVFVPASASASSTSSRAVSPRNMSPCKAGSEVNPKLTYTEKETLSNKVKKSKKSVPDLVKAIYECVDAHRLHCVRPACFPFTPICNSACCGGGGGEAALLTDREAGLFLESMAEAVLARVMAEVRESGSVALLCDTVTAAGEEYVSVMVRYATRAGDVSERLLALPHAQGATGDQLFESFASLCARGGVSWKDSLRSLSTDAHAGSASAYHRLLERLRRDVPHLPLVWNSAHRMGDIIAQVFCGFEEGKRFIRWAESLRDYLKVAGRAKQLRDLCGDTLPAEPEPLAAFVLFLHRHLKRVKQCLRQLESLDPYLAPVLRNTLESDLCAPMLTLFVKLHEKWHLPAGTLDTPAVAALVEHCAHMTDGWVLDIESDLVLSIDDTAADPAISQKFSLLARQISDRLMEILRERLEPCLPFLQESDIIRRVCHGEVEVCHHGCDCCSNEKRRLMKKLKSCWEKTPSLRAGLTAGSEYVPAVLLKTYSSRHNTGSHARTPLHPLLATLCAVPTSAAPSTLAPPRLQLLRRSLEAHRLPLPLPHLQALMVLQCAREDFPGKGSPSRKTYCQDAEKIISEKLRH